ncbi:MAG: peptidoglycan-binding protein [Clostridiales bacterium]|nr:peptidoglycan-binding protein [Clostridiales bacterium]MDY5514723.1 peptidoglycan-binding protein [Candidatus Ventricola sp.]
MKRIFSLILLLSLLALPASGLPETILWEDENGVVILGDDGAIGFSPLTPTPAPDAQQTPFPAPPTPAPEGTAQAENDFVYKRKLQYGDSGALVEALQSRLLELGFYEARVSGGFYSVTQAAVKAFQAHNGLSVDGVAGRETQELLFSANAVPASATPRPSPTPVPPQYTLMVDVANQITRAYTYDENGEYTVLVREMICSTGTASNPTPLGTTVMPSKRARWGYFPTWDSHAQYLTRIDSANAFHSVLYSAADETTLSVKSFEALGTPASHGCVRLLVSDAKWIYDNCKAGTIITVYEGEYDPEYTMTLKPTLNTATLRENPLPEPTPTPVYSPENWPQSYRTLSRGKTGEDVYMVQMRLTELGYYHGSVTGGYYGGTIEAVKAFQRDHGLSVDGAAGKQTQSLLFSAAVDPTPEVTPAPELTPAPEPTPEPTAAPTPILLMTPEPTPRGPLPDSVG